MPQSTKLNRRPLETVERQPEAWRDFAREIGGGQWFNVRAIGDTAHVSITGEIDFGDHWETLADNIGGAKEIRLSVNSTGGNALLALAFFEFFHGQISETKITGRAFSAAYTMALAGSRVLMERNAKIMLHAPQLFCYGGFLDFVNRARSLKSVTDRTANIIREKTEQPAEVVDGWLTDKADHFFTSEQALAYGLVDAVYDAPKIFLPSPACPPAMDSAPIVAAPNITEREQLFLDFLSAFTADGKFEVHDRNEFFREVFSTLTFNTTETPKVL